MSERGGILADPLRYRWLIFCVVGVVYFLVCLHRISTTVIAKDLVREFSATATQLGVMASAYFYLYAAMQPLVGICADTIGPRRLISFFTMVACGGALVLGLAPNMTIATLGRALIGIGVAAVFVPSLKLFSQWFREREFASVTGMFLATGNAGNLSASLPLTYLVLWLGWRGSLFAIGGLSLVMALLAWMIIRDRPKDMGWGQVESVSSAVPLSSSPATTGRVKTVLSWPTFWMLFASMFFFGGPGLTFQSLWVVPYLMDVHGFTRTQAGGMFMLLPMGFIVGAPVVGMLSDRLALGRKAVLLGTLAVGLLCWGSISAYGGRPPAGILPVLFLIMGSCGGGSLSLYMTVMKEAAPAWLTGTAVGLMNTAAFISTAVYQPITGMIMDHVGRVGEVYPIEAYEHVFLLFVLSMAAGLASVLALRPTKADSA